MNRSKKYMMAAALATLSCGAMAQGLNTGYFIDGYTFRHNLNPAYGNDQNYVSIPALGNIQVRTQGNFGLGDVLFDNPRYGIDSDKKKTTFMNPYIADGEALKGFASGNNRINADVDITLLSAGFKAWGGYNTISLDARTNVGLSLPYELFAFATRATKAMTSATSTPMPSRLCNSLWAIRARSTTACVSVPR